MSRSTPSKTREIVARPLDRAVLVGADLGGGVPVDDSMVELALLANTAGAQVVGTLVQRLSRAHPRTFLGKGKIEELAQMVAEREATLVVFDDDLTPSQQANIEDLVPNTKLLDRTALILDIFALHATSREGKLQVELAQMEYLLPRLRGMWRHLARSAAAAGGALGIGTRGPGETQLETDRRIARKRVQELRRELKHVAANRMLQRKGRADSGVFRIALVGYTNAGKSTLLNSLTGAEVLVEDMLFATLDSTTRRLDLPEGRTVTLTDTVGFIRKLPHGLVEAFKSTLDEVREAHLLLHVVDASHALAREQASAVLEVLGEIGAATKPQVLVYNKVDLLPEGEREALASRAPGAVLVSAARGEGLEALVERISREAARGSTTLTLLVPYTRGDIVRMAHARAQVIAEEHTAEGTRLTVRAPSELVDVLREFESAAPSDL